MVPGGRGDGTGRRLAVAEPGPTRAGFRLFAPEVSRLRPLGKAEVLVHLLGRLDFVRIVVRIVNAERSRSKSGRRYDLTNAVKSAAA